MRIEVDRGSCQGAGLCALTAPDVFDQDDAGVVELLDANPPDTETDAVYTAENLCPARAITVS